MNIKIIILSLLCLNACSDTIQEVKLNPKADKTVITSGENLNVKYVSKFNMAFQSVYNIKDLDLSLWNTKNAISFLFMYASPHRLNAVAC